MKILRKIKIFLLFIIPVNLAAMDLPLEIYLGITNNHILNKEGVFINRNILNDKIDGSGYGVSTEFRYLITEQLRISFDFGYDFQSLSQNNVLDEWEWRYWEDRYIDFLPGIDAEEANRTLSYNSADGIYSAIFKPSQQLKELKFALSMSYLYPINHSMSMVPSLQFGATLFTRELQMREDWIRRYDLDNNDTLDYDYEFELLHFAPDKKGTRFFIAPGVGLKYNLSQNYDLEIDIKFVQYLKRDYTGSIEDLFNFSKNSEKWFPINSKIILRFGFIFKY